MSAALQSYSTGTVSVTQDDEVVELAGDGAAWLQSWCVPGCQMVIAGEAQANYIVEWIDANHVRLALPVVRATAADLTYSILITAPAFGTNRLGALTAVERIRLMTENDVIAQLLGIADGAAVTPALDDIWALWDKSDDGNVKAGTAEGLLRLASSIAAKSANYAVVASGATSDYGKLIVMSAAGAARTVTLPAAATAGTGFAVGIKKSDASANVVTIAAAGADLIDGAASAVLTDQYDYLWVRCDGAAWQVIGSTAEKLSENLTDLAALPSVVNLVALAALAGSADKLAYWTGGNVMQMTTLTAFARTLLDDPDAATMLATLGALAAANPTFTGALTGPQLRLPSNIDAGPTSTDHPFQIGPDNGSNLRIDNNEIVSLNNGSPAALFINTDGGGVTIGGASSEIAIPGSVDYLSIIPTINPALFVGNTSAISSTLCRISIGNVSSANAGIASMASNDSTRVHVSIESATSGVVGSITSVSGGTNYNTSSDYRLKQDIVPLVEYGTFVADGLEVPLSRVMQYRPVEFAFKTNPDSRVRGFIAHEFADVNPAGVTGEKDAERTVGYVWVEPVFAERPLLDEEGNDTGEVETFEAVPAQFYADAPEDLAEEVGGEFVPTGTAPVYQQLDASKAIPDMMAAIQILVMQNADLAARVAQLEAAQPAA